MKRGHWFFLSVLAGAALTAGGAVRAERGELELVRLDSPQSPAGQTAEQEACRNVTAQDFSLQTGEGAAEEKIGDDFKKAVKKEPEKYLSKHPFRGTAKLGGKEYGFVLDKKTEKSRGYNRLYFDRNGNGDLTDDEPVDAEGGEPSDDAPEQSFVEHQFPRVDLTLDVDGKKLDYAFFFSNYSYGSGKNQFTSAMLVPGVYRRGEITLDGKKRKIAVLDYNSNGRFDDVVSLPKRPAGGDEGPAVEYGDVLIDLDQPPRRERTWPPPAESGTQFLAKLTILGDKYFTVKVTPTGDALLCEPSTVGRGQVVSPEWPCRMDLVGELGQVSLNLEKSKPAAVPAGEWRVNMYFIQITNWQEPDKKSDKEVKKEKEKAVPGKTSLLGALQKALLGAIPKSQPASSPRSNLSMVMARGTAKGKPIVVEAGGTTTLKFGPPYKLSATVQSSPGVAQLSLDLDGIDGERVGYLLVNGNRPPAPTLRITDPQGEVVAKGNFEYG